MRTKLMKSSSLKSRMTHISKLNGQHTLIKSEVLKLPVNTTTNSSKKQMTNLSTIATRNILTDILLEVKPKKSWRQGAQRRKIFKISFLNYSNWNLCGRDTKYKLRKGWILIWSRWREELVKVSSNQSWWHLTKCSQSTTKRRRRYWN
jgi:hypothetical protein